MVVKILKIYEKKEPIPTAVTKWSCIQSRVVHNPAILAGLFLKTGNPNKFLIILAIFENSGKSNGIT